MKTVIMHYINVDDNTSFEERSFNLLIEKDSNNFFKKSINYFNLFKIECPTISKETFHIFIPNNEGDNRMLETLPDLDMNLTLKRFVCMNMYINNSLNFSVFRENYKKFLFEINGKDFFEYHELFISENTIHPFSDVRTCPLMESNKFLAKKPSKNNVKYRV